MLYIYVIISLYIYLNSSSQATERNHYSHENMHLPIKSC